MKGYKHLSYSDRLKIEAMLAAGAKQKEIAEALHVHPSTICRELKRPAYYTRRNSDLTEERRYSPEKADAQYRMNMEAKGAQLKIANCQAFADRLEELIVDEGYSPAAALAEIRENEPEKYQVDICRVTLYSYIEKGIFLRLTNKNLPIKSKRKGKYRHVRPARPPRGESIENRPAEIETREEFGNWEMDTVMGKKKTKKCLLVLTERNTRQEVVRLLPDKTAASVVAAIDSIEKRYGRLFTHVFRSITVDNGSEFSDCQGMERSIYGGTRTKFFYCHPYSAWERGSNEKQNQMLRRKFPKGTDFDNVTQAAVDAAVEWLNNYPRELFGWKKSSQLFEQQLAAI